MERSLFPDLLENVSLYPTEIQLKLFKKLAEEYRQMSMSAHNDRDTAAFAENAKRLEQMAISAAA